jgi:hypothetical protein
MHSRGHYEQQLELVNDILYRKKRDLFYNRKYELHSLSEQQKEMDIKALKFLLGLTVAKKDEITERRDELIKICLENKINNPIIGAQHYDPRAFDYSRKQ